MKKQTLLLTENFPPVSGGSSRWFWELYSRLDKNDVIVVTNETQENLTPDIKNSELTILRIPLQCAEWGFKSVAGLSFYFKTVLNLRKIIKQHNITHIHCGRVIHEGVIAWLLSLITSVKFICYVHGEDVETAATSREHNLMVKQVCKHSALLICNSQNTANIVTRLNYASTEKIEILNPGVDATKFVPANEDITFKEKMGWLDKRVIITVGRLQQRKGQDNMIKAMALIKQQMPDVVYAVIGRGECYNLLSELQLELGLEQEVQLLDEISDEEMIKCYQQCDLFILPNRTIDNDIEGFGMVLVEAQSCQKPVIAGNSGGTKETMLIGTSGLVVDCTEPQVIANEVLALLANPEKLTAMGIAGREHVLKELDWQAHTVKAKKIFAKL